jgi:RimJ/RimL family protein N-acetyltransferase
MIGDVNLFLNDSDDIHCGEIEIMIAEAAARQKGYGMEALYTFLRYGS